MQPRSYASHLFPPPDPASSRCTQLPPEPFLDLRYLALTDIRSLSLYLTVSGRLIALPLPAPGTALRLAFLACLGRSWLDLTNSKRACCSE